MATTTTERGWDVSRSNARRCESEIERAFSALARGAMKIAREANDARTIEGRDDDDDDDDDDDAED